MPKLRASLTVATAMAAVLAAPPSTAARPDPLRPRQWTLDRIHAPAAWRFSTGRGVLVAVIDSGVDLRQPDLRGKLVVAKGADLSDPKGCLDNHCHDDGPQDLYGHGTGMASIIAASRDNGIGMAGVAPDARVLPVRVDSAHSPMTVRRVASAIRFAADHGARVINMSIGFAELPYELSSNGVSAGSAYAEEEGVDALYAAVEYAWQKGAVLVAASGNGWPSTGPVPGVTAQGVQPGKPECNVPAL
ncbi:MAG: S8 family serine peptidase, partial [Frankia sp.]|nr:S8 family serine peptidase [Frankia sp.]